MLAFGAAVLVSACGDSGDDAAGSSDTERTSSPSPSPSVGPSSTPGTSPGADAGATVAPGVPAGFPADVPLIDEPIVNAVKGEPGGRFAWSVVMQTKRSVEQVTADVKKDFEAAGYSVAQGSEMADLSVLNFKSDAYEVGVTAGRTTDSVTITYVVKDAR